SIGAFCLPERYSILGRMKGWSSTVSLSSGEEISTMRLGIFTQSSVLAGKRAAISRGLYFAARYALGCRKRTEAQSLGLGRKQDNGEEGVLGVVLSRDQESGRGCSLRKTRGAGATRQRRKISGARGRKRSLRGGPQAAHGDHRIPEPRSRGRGARQPGIPG